MARWQDEILSNIPYANSELDLTELGKQIREKFPKGKMALNNPTPWRQSARDLANKLLRFHQNYGYDYTKDEILAATDLYVKQYYQPRHGNMRCSQHFIIKFPGTENMVSDLATYIDMIRDGEDDSSSPSANWTEDLCD